MVTAQNGERPARSRIFPLLNIFHPRAVDADGNLVFRFAGNGARVAANAFSIVDDEAVVHSDRLC